MKHVISFSGGLGSYFAAKRVAAKYGTKDLYLVFCDTLIEDPDLYRFLEEAAAKIGGTFVRLCDGRRPWDIFRDKRYGGNTRTAHCSTELKSKPFYAWLAKQGEVTVYLGIDWSESHRLKPAQDRQPLYKIEAPLCDAPYLTRTDMFNELRNDGIELPDLYKMGFSHNNCGGCCVKAGLGQWRDVLEKMPERYTETERLQNDLMRDIPTVLPFLRKTVKKEKEYLTLTAFRETIQSDADQYDIGGCGCFLD